MNALFRKSVFRRFVPAVCAVALLATSLQAQKPLAVVSMKPSDQLRKDVDYLLQATGTAPMAAFVMPVVKEYLQHVDGDRPIGMAVTIDETGSEFTPMAFVPVTDSDAFVAQIELMMGPAGDAGGDVREFQMPDQSVFLKEQDGWLFVSQTAEALENTPENPAEMLQGLDESYDLAIQANLSNLPQFYKQMAMAQIQAGVEAGLTDQDNAESIEAVKEQMEQMQQLMDDVDVITFGWAIDPAKKETHMDFSMTALAGSDMAKQMEPMAKTSTKYSGFLVPGAAISGNLSSVIPEDQIDQFVASLDSAEQSALTEIENDEQLQDDAARDAAKKLVKMFVDIGRNTAKTGKMDAAMSLVLKPKAMTMIAAAHVADGSEVEKAVMQIVDMAKNEPEFAAVDVKFNAGVHNGVRLHTLAMPVPEDEYSSQVFGDKLNLVIGASDDSAYVAVGTDSMEYLKKVIDSSTGSAGEAVDPIHGRISLLPMMEFADSIEANPMIGAMTQILEQSEGKDSVEIRASYSDNKMTYRLTIQEGVLKMLGQGAQMANGGGF